MNCKLFFSFNLLVGLTGITSANIPVPSSMGQQFVFSVPSVSNNREDYPQVSSQLQLTTMSDSPVEVKLSTPIYSGARVSRMVTVLRHKVTRVVLPGGMNCTAYVSSEPEICDATFLLEANGDIAVTLVSRGPGVSSATTLYPSSEAGSQYRVAACRWHTVIHVAAVSANETSVLFTPSVSVSHQNQVYAAGESIAFTLQQYQTLNLIQRPPPSTEDSYGYEWYDSYYYHDETEWPWPGDGQNQPLKAAALSGSQITSGQPVTVISGCVVSEESGQDEALTTEALLPVSSWGDTFVVTRMDEQEDDDWLDRRDQERRSYLNENDDVPSQRRQGHHHEVLQIIADSSSTWVNITGMPPRLIQAGMSVEVVFGDDDSDSVRRENENNGDLRLRRDTPSRVNEGRSIRQPRGGELTRRNRVSGKNVIVKSSAPIQVIQVWRQFYMAHDYRGMAARMSTRTVVPKVGWVHRMVFSPIPLVNHSGDGGLRSQYDQQQLIIVAPARAERGFRLNGCVLPDGIIRWKHFAGIAIGTANMSGRRIHKAIELSHRDDKFMAYLMVNTEYDRIATPLAFNLNMQGCQKDIDGECDEDYGDPTYQEVTDKDDNGNTIIYLAVGGGVLAVALASILLAVFVKIRYRPRPRQMYSVDRARPLSTLSA